MTVTDLEAAPLLDCPHTTGGSTPLRDRRDAARAARAINQAAAARGDRRRVHPITCLCGAWSVTANARAVRAARASRRGRRRR